MNRARLFQGIVMAVLLTTMRVFAESALTIYNQNFAVVRDQVALDLKRGTNEVNLTDITAHLEPDSVILRDPSGKRGLQILEQNYRSDPVSEGLLLSIYEGKENIVSRRNERDQGEDHTQRLCSAPIWDAAIRPAVQHGSDGLCLSTIRRRTADHRSGWAASLQPARSAAVPLADG